MGIRPEKSTAGDHQASGAPLKSWTSPVKLYVDGKFVCEGKVADPKTFSHRYSCQWNSNIVRNGDYMVTVEVFGPAGES